MLGVTGGDEGMGRQSSFRLPLLLLAAATCWVDTALPQVTQGELLIPDLREC